MATLISFFPRSPFKNFSATFQPRVFICEERLTQFSLGDLLIRESENRYESNHDIYDNSGHRMSGLFDFGVNLDSYNNALDAFKHAD